MHSDEKVAFSSCVNIFLLEYSIFILFVKNEVRFPR